MPETPMPRTDGKTYTYLTARDGHYLFKRNGIFKALVPTDYHPDYEALQPSFEFTAPRIPCTLMEQAAAFFRAVYDLHKTEAAILLCFDPSAGWTLYVPQQTVSSLAVEYENDEDRRVVGSIHSHPGIACRASATDEKDEAEFDGLHIVINPLTGLEHGMTITASVNGRRFPLKPEVVIEGYVRPTVVVPEEWLAKVAPAQAFEAPPANLWDPHEFADGSEEALSWLEREREFMP